VLLEAPDVPGVPIRDTGHLCVVGHEANPLVAQRDHVLRCRVAAGAVVGDHVVAVDFRDVAIDEHERNVLPLQPRQGLHTLQVARQHQAPCRRSTAWSPGKMRMPAAPAWRSCPMW
jgi:hypothetical protein